MKIKRTEDMEAALECRQPAGAIPVWELHYHCWGKISGKKYTFYEDFMKLSEQQKNNAIKQNAEIMAAESEQLGFAAVTVPDSPWGCPYTLPKEYRHDLARLLCSKTSDLMVVAACGSIIGMPGSEDYAEFCYRLVDNPEQIDEQCKSVLKKGIEKMKQFAATGVKAVYSASDMADNHGPFFKPEYMDRFILPYLHKWSEAVKAEGLYAILHTDGNIGPILNELAGTGIHAIQAVDPVAGMDMKKSLEATDGRVCLCGNVDCGLLLTGTPDQLYENAKNLIKSCKFTNGFVLGASNAVVAETPIENYLAVMRAWREFGRFEIN